MPVLLLELLGRLVRGGRVRRTCAGADYDFAIGFGLVEPGEGFCAV